MEERYIYKGGRQLRFGFTTGTCAAAAAKAAAQMLLDGRPPESVTVRIPEGSYLTIPVEICLREEDACICAVRKDSGDDPDVTDGMLVYAKVSEGKDEKMILSAGEGVGRVTRSGLSVPVGEPAINPVPRQMILQAVRDVWEQFSVSCGALVEISVPGGEALARKTFNPRLGIEGGISILGTTGLVEPMSEEALTRTIALETKMAVENGNGYVLMVPGNYGESFVRSSHLADGIQPVKCSNYVGESLDAAACAGAKGVLYVAHIGKFVKLAEGMMNTHSAFGDARMAILCAQAVRCGAASLLLLDILDSMTTDEAIGHIQKAGLLEPVMEGLMRKIEEHLKRRAEERFRVGAIVFSNVYGILGRTGQAEELLAALKREKLL